MTAVYIENRMWHPPSSPCNSRVASVVVSEALEVHSVACLFTRNSTDALACRATVAGLGSMICIPL